jgi:hypothetical protein
VVVGWNDSSVQVTSVVDTKGNSYYASNIQSAAPNSNVVTINYNSAAAYPDVRILEYSGVDPVNGVDGTVSATGDSFNCTTGPVKTINANDLLVGANIVKTLTEGPKADIRNEF